MTWVKEIIQTPAYEKVVATTAVCSREAIEIVLANARARMTGHLSQSRFASFAMNDAHFLNALRYLAFNPVRAGLAASPRGWPWSSVRAHLEGRDDAPVEVGPALERAPRFADLLELSLDEQAALDGFENLSPNGRPLGGPDFIAILEGKLGRTVRPGKRGRKPQSDRAI